MLFRSSAAPDITVGGIAALTSSGVQAAVSMCRLGSSEYPLPTQRHLLVPLIDTNSESENLNLEFLLYDTATMVHHFVQLGWHTAVHCVAAQSRTPAVAAAYLVLHRGMTVDEALAAVRSALPHANPQPRFIKALQSFAPN